MRTKQTHACSRGGVPRYHVRPKDQRRDVVGVAREVKTQHCWRCVAAKHSGERDGVYASVFVCVCVGGRVCVCVGGWVRACVIDA